MTATARMYRASLILIVFLTVWLLPAGIQAAPKTYLLTVTTVGSGSVASTPAGIACGSTCSAGFKNNTRVTLTASAAAGATFQGWSGACAGTTDSCTVKMSQVQNVEATFVHISLPLTVIKTGSGVGTVTSVPAGIDCGAICGALFEPNTEITLTAAAADGSSFTGWAGPCSGTNATCTLTLKQARTVYAGFSVPAVHSYQYDPNGNLTQYTGPLNHLTQHDYDALDQTVQTRQPHPDLSGQTLGLIDTEYDGLGRISRLTDPRNLSTDYQRNAFGDLLTLTSPDTGITTFTYDTAGNVSTQTDARGKTAAYIYDSQNRITRIGYADQTVTYAWDSCTHGIGRLCSLNNGSSQLAFGYDLHGRIIQQSQTVGTVTLTVHYHYNLDGQLDQHTTPSGQLIAYAWQDGRIASITVNGQPVIGQIAYEPDGQVGGWVWGNNTPSQRLYDLSGRLVLVDFGLDAQSQLPETLIYGYDAAGRVTDTRHQVNVPADQHHDYDGLDRLTASNQGVPNQNNDRYTYDLSGNRTGTLHNASAETHSIDPGSNRLQGISGSTSKSYSYDAAGHLTGDGSLTYGYNDTGRRITPTGPTLNAIYAYNGLGQRVQKTVNGVTRLFAYDTQGHLLGEYDAAGNLIQEMVWFGNLPIAVLKPVAPPGTGIDVFYVHSDHLGTPRKVSRPNDNQVLWEWEGEVFGNTPPNQNPSGQGDFVFNLRFPGQYYDAETGLHYNYYRDYNPELGRYIASDPIGLAGGINTYAYVENNPLSYIDSLGLDRIYAVGQRLVIFPDGQMTPAESVIVQAGYPEANGPMAFLNGAARAVGTALSFCPTSRGALAAKSAVGSGKTVLGHYPAYKQLANILGARHFSIPEGVWNNMSEAERWAANQKFLDRMISRGDDIILSTTLDSVRPGSYYAQELQYLGSKGYVLSADGTQLIKP